MKYDKQGSRAHVGRNYVAINRRNYPVIVTDVELDIVNTIYIKNEKEELEDIKSLDFVIRDDLNESVLLCGCKNKIYFTDIINHPRQARLLVSCLCTIWSTTSVSNKRSVSNHHLTPFSTRSLFVFISNAETKGKRHELR